MMSRKAAVVDAQSFVEVASSISRSVNISLVDKKEVKDISDSIGLEKCFSEAKPLPGISRFHCIEPQGNESVNCCLYSLQLLDTNRPPGVYLFNDSDVDDSDSQSFRKESCDKENDNSSDAEFVSEDESESEIKVIKEVRTGYPPHSSTKESPNANVKQGIPDELYSLFEKTPTCLPQYISTQVQAILKGQITFCGSNLIAMADMQSLVGNLDTKDKWLINFVIDEYFKLIQSASQEKGIKVKTLPWEIFNKCESSLVAKHLQKDEFPFIQDLIAVPYNPTHSDHWFLLAALPKKKIVIVLDSLAGDIVKPTAQNALNKMGSALLNIDPSCNLENWNFICNFKHDIPQQVNGDDCGVYTCLYARCLAGLGPMVQESFVP